MSLSQIRRAAVLVVFVALGTACRTASVQPGRAAAAGPNCAPAYHNLDATLWVQTSAEYRAAALQAYNTATAMLDRALADPHWTALPEQSDDFGALPPAVILDVDETILDNSAYQARLIMSGTDFDPASWTRFVQDQVAVAVPGAVAFTRHANERGVEVFFVTNHTQADEPWARKRLETEGFPLDPRLDTFLSVGDKSSAPTSDKTERRRWIADRYRVLLQVGDSLGDFISEPAGPVSERRLVADRYSSWWGTKWILIPDPMYGAWERAILKSPTPLTPDQKVEKKLQALHGNDR